MSNQSSRLLLLPAEIRNHIYELVLTSGKALLYEEATDHRKPRFIVEQDLPNLNELNQIKYVCHQLYKETAGIEIKFNEVIFEGGTDGIIIGLNEEDAYHATEVFSDFLSGCSPTKATWFSSVILWSPFSFADDPIEPYVLGPASSLLPLAAFCAAHPRTKVTYRLRCWDFNPTIANFFFHRGLCFEAMLQHRLPSLQVPSPRLDVWPTNPGDFDTAMLWADDAQLRALSVPNLRFLSHMSDYDYMDYREVLIKYDKDRFNVQIVKQKMKDWYENGIRAGISQ